MLEREFTIHCKMKDRWVPHFLSMLKHMQFLGRIGSSRKVAIYSDGDGDFRPEFKWSPFLKCNEAPVEEEENGDRLYDAG